VGEVSDIGTVWNFTWRRHLFMWEEEVLVKSSRCVEVEIRGDRGVYGEIGIYEVGGCCSW